MASQKFIFLLVIISSAAIETFARTGLESVCDLALDRNFCLNDFGADPAAKHGTVPEIASLATARAQANATATETKIRTLLRQAKDLPLRNTLRDCYGHYVAAVIDLQTAAVDITSKNFEDLRLHGRSASNHGTSCQSLFIKLRTFPLEAENRSLQLLGNIIEVAAYLI